jgi:Lactate racemase N-terminal domain
VPLLTGSRVAVVDAPHEAVILQAPPAQVRIADVGAAVRDALRFPLSGEPLEGIVPRGGRVTIVADLPTLPLPGALFDPRQRALAAAVAELERLGVPGEQQTLLVAGGLARRPHPRELESLVAPTLARRFHGRVEVHDVERPDLVELGSTDSVPLRVHPAAVKTDAVVVVSAAESVLHGGPAALLAAAGAEELRAAGASSLLETSSAAGWELAVALERELGRRVPMIGASLSLNNPSLAGAFHGYPNEAGSLERTANARLRRLLNVLPGPLRKRALRWSPRTVSAAAAFAGPPSVAHAEALLQAIEVRAARLEGELDAICLGIPPATPYLPREAPNPVLAAYLGLGLALRSWRDAFPVAEGGTAILVHRFRRHFPHPTQQPYRVLFQALRFGRAPEELAAAERAAATDERAIAAYRERRACHPLLPFADWAACGPALGKLGAVLIAGCRDATAARQLGFVPTRGVAAALAMAHGRAGRPPRLGFLVAPPYFPVLVSSGK